MYFDLIKTATLCVLHAFGLIIELDFMGFYRPKPIIKPNLIGLNIVYKVQVIGLGRGEGFKFR
jgi:hypothetical protein